MVDITQPSIWGYAITPWFIALCLCVLGSIIFAVWVVLGFSKRGLKEREMIENAVKNTSNIPIKNIAMPMVDFGIDDQSETESTVDKKSSTFETEGFDSSLERISNETEGFGFKDEVLRDETAGVNGTTESFGLDSKKLAIKTDDIDYKTEGFDFKKEGITLKTEALGMCADSLGDKTGSLIFHSVTESFISDEAEAFESDETEGLEKHFPNHDPVKVESKFCSQCGRRVNGKFCSYCGYKIK